MSSCIRLPAKDGKDKSKGTFGRRRGCKSKFPALTVEAGEVSPVEQGAVEGWQGDVEEQIGAVGRVSDGVGEQVHLQQGLDQVAQHLAVQRDLHSLCGFTVTLSLSVFSKAGVHPQHRLLCLLKCCYEDVLWIPSWFKYLKTFEKILRKLIIPMKQFKNDQIELTGWLWMRDFAGGPLAVTPSSSFTASDRSFLLVSFVLESHNFTRCLPPHKKTASRSCERIQQCDDDPAGFAALLSPTPPSGSSCVPPSLSCSPPPPPPPLSLSLSLSVMGSRGSRGEREQVLLAINV